MAKAKKEVEEKLDVAAEIVPAAQETIAIVETPSEDVVARESAVNSRIQWVAEREKAIASIESELTKKQIALEALLPSIDQKQAIVASKIAQSEEILEKISKASDELAKKGLSLSTEKEENQKLLDELKEKVLVLKRREMTLDEKERSIISLRETLAQKTKELEQRDNDVDQKQKEIDRINKDMNLQKRELAATQAKVQRLITLNKMEKEVQDS